MYTSFIDDVYKDVDRFRSGDISPPAQFQAVHVQVQSNLPPENGPADGVHSKLASKKMSIEKTAYDFFPPGAPFPGNFAK